MNMNNGDLLWQHVKGLPAFRALLRSVEARFYQDLLPLPEPVLDVGCGDGHFAAVALHGTSHPLTAGIDPGEEVLREAQTRGAYRLLIRSLGDALPFPSDHFATALSNSVLEHIPEVEPVVTEVARVLRPGGRFIFCVPSDHFADLLFFPQLFRKRPLRMERLACAYERYFSGVCRHYHNDGPQTWQQRLALAGLEIVDSFYYLSAQAQHAVELGHYLGLPSLVAKKLTGRWIVAPTRWNLALTERILRPLYDENRPPVGAYLFFVTRKPDRGEVAAASPRVSQESEAGRS